TAVCKSDSRARQGCMAELRRHIPALSRKSCDGSPGRDARTSSSSPTAFAVNAPQAQPLTNVSHPGLTEHALSMPPWSNGPNISKTLRCYKGETLCNPLFSKTVLH